MGEHGGAGGPTRGEPAGGGLFPLPRDCPRPRPAPAHPPTHTISLSPPPLHTTHTGTSFLNFGMTDALRNCFALEVLPGVEPSSPDCNQASLRGSGGGEGALPAAPPAPAAAPLRPTRTWPLVLSIPPHPPSVPGHRSLPSGSS